MHNLKRNYIILVLCLPLTGWAQLQVYPLERKAAAPKSATTPSARVQAVTPISLPFWDDFSYTKDNYPVDFLWISPTSKSVCISDGQGINPPTINVATFDGLNANGTPYSPAPTDYQDFGYRDTLESQPIKMTEVTLPFRNKIFLTFFYQWGGNGEPPDANDFLRLEFKDNTGVWDVIATLKADDTTDPTVFNPYAFRINQDEYYHDEFQFRFISYGRKSGRYDAWHIDYVYLNEHDPNELSVTSISDRAMTVPFSSVLGDYFSVPYSHFKSDFKNNFTLPVFEVMNLKDTVFPQAVNYASYFTIKNYINGAEVISFNDSIQNKGPMTDLGSLERSEYQITMLPDTALYFDDQADSAKIVVKIGVNSGDNKKDYWDRYKDINFRLNDTITHTFNIANYYAYDDGIAEYSAGNAQAFNQLAYRFDMKTDDEDTINGLFVHFPIFAGDSPNTVQFFIREDSVNGMPLNKAKYTQSVIVSRNNNNKFVLVELDKGVPVQGKFFVGYTEPSTGHVRIGLDKSNNTGDRLYHRSSEGAEWLLNDRVEGSLMIRPRFGSAADVITGLPETPNHISVYPNPNDGNFYIKGNTRVLGIITITGQTVEYSLEEVGDQKRISMTNPPSGFYILKYQDGAGVSSAKICIRK